ncbi:MAG: hypothetical protein WBL40_11050 [Terrimicrobiaceae bacterium]
MKMAAQAVGKVAYFITHPNVIISEDIPATRWPLSELGRARMLKCLGSALGLQNHIHLFQHGAEGGGLRKHPRGTLVPAIRSDSGTRRERPLVYRVPAARRV